MGERTPPSRTFQAQSGFTLVELAVLLAVIALLLGVVLKGHALLHQSRVRKTIQMVEDVRTAANLFYRNQGRLPGDGITIYPLTATTVPAPDGWVTGGGLSTLSGEAKLFINELVGNGYLAGKLDNRWSHPLGGKVWVEKLAGVTPTENWIILDGISATEDQSAINAHFDGDGDLSVGRVKQYSTVLLIAL